MLIQRVRRGFCYLASHSVYYCLYCSLLLEHDLSFSLAMLVFNNEDNNSPVLLHDCIRPSLFSVLIGRPVEQEKKC